MIDYLLDKMLVLLSCHIPDMISRMLLLSIKLVWIGGSKGPCIIGGMKLNLKNMEILG